MNKKRKATNKNFKDQYLEQLNDSRWKDLKDKIMERAKYECEICHNYSLPLQIHHIHYVSGRKAWQYHPDLLTCLCSECHHSMHHCWLCEEKITYNQKINNTDILMDKDGFPEHKKCYEEWLKWTKEYEERQVLIDK